MILANKLLKGIWKSIVVLGGILVGSMVYYSVMGYEFPAKIKRRITGDRVKAIRHRITTMIRGVNTASSVLFHLFFALLLALAMILANKLLKGIWKSIVVLGGKSNQTQNHNNDPGSKYGL